MPTPTTLNETVAEISVAEIAARVQAIAAICGPNAHVSASVTASRYDRKPGAASVSVYPDDITSSRNHQHFKADTWAEALDAAQVWASSQGTIQREAAIRRMALLIVDLTDQHGNCTEAMLTRQDFSQTQVRDLHAAACERAGEMCQGAPFSVTFA